MILIVSINSSLLAQETSTQDSILISKYQSKIQYFEGRNFDSTIYYLNKLEELPLSPRKRASLNIDLGNMFLYKGELYFAMKYYLQVKEYGVKENDFLAEVAGNISTATVFIRKDEYEKAIEILKESEKRILEYKPKSDKELQFQTRSLVTTYINLALSLSELKEYGSATKYIDESIAISDSIGDSYNLALAYSDKADILESTGSYKEAIALNYKALKLREKDGELLDITRSLNNLGETYFNYNKPDSAFYYLQKGYKNSEELGLVYDVYQSAKLLSALYAQKDDYANAYKFLQIYIDNKEKYQDSEKMNAIADLSYKYKLKLIKSEQEAKNRVLYGTIVILLLLIVIATLLYFLQRKAAESSKKEQEKLLLSKQLVEEKLEYKNKQLVTNVMHQISSNEFMLQISEQLKTLSKDLGVSQKNKIYKIIKEMKKASDDSVLNEFELAFQEVHTDFYNKLDKMFSLTNAERRMAAFIRLNLSSKEISAITGQSVRTIDVTRYRLRKKMNINNTDTNLSSFLAKL